MKLNPMMMAMVATGLLHGGIEAAEVVGVLKDQRNQTIPNAIIHVRDQNIETRTNNEGEFKLDLPAGKYTLDVKGGSEVHFHQAIIVTADTTTIDLQLPYHMDEIVVVMANPLEHTKLDMATPSIVLSADTLAMKRATTLGDILEQEPGMSMSSFGPAVARPVIRGLAGGRVLITNNQMTVQDASITSNDHDVGLEPLLAEQVEVLKGPASLLYGSGAIGGVVNVADGRINQYGADGVNGGVEVRLGDSATSEETVIAKITGGDNSFTYYFDAFTTSTDDIEIPGEAESEIYHEAEHAGEDHEEEEEGVEGLLENSASKSEGLTAGVTWIRDWGYVGLALNRSTKLYGIPGEGHAHEEEHGDEDEDHMGEDHEEEESVSIDMEQTRIDFQAGINNPLDGFDEWYFGLTNTDYEHVELEGPEVGTLFRNEATEFKTFLKHKPADGWRGIIGLQYTDRDFAAIGDEAFVPPSNTSSTALFVLEEKRIDDLKFELGARFERQSISVDDFSDVDESMFSFSAGTVFDITDGQRLAINLASSERAPAVEELYSFGEHLATQTFEVGDPNLVPETSLNLDISYRFKADRFSGEINAYWNSFSDFIYGQVMPNTGSVTDLMGNTVAIDDDFPVVAFRQQDADIRGFEVDVDYQLVTDADYDLTIGFMGEVIEAELANERELPRIPPWKMGINLHYDYELLSADLSYTKYRDQNQIGMNELPTLGFDMLDFEIAYRVPVEGQDLLIFLKGKNLLDEEARDHTSYLKDFAPRAGRSLVLGARYQF